MSMIQIQPAPFFASKNRAFWILQLGGWGGVFVLRAVVSLANSQPIDLLAVTLVTTITGFSISLILSVIYRQLINRPPIVTWTSTALVLFVAVGLQASIDAWIQGIYLGTSLETSFVQRFVGLSFIPMTLLGGWSALYYAINYFLTVEEQADRLQRLETQKTAAQLAMLRYQLNPHFLFNTLNSISTLVLLKETGPANAMLTRLSHFLRHTLIIEPGSQVTLEQEIETLQLYLDIERMRFEERLRTSFDIEEAAKSASLPSMLLQPLIENAIKYAVSQLEEGAEISVKAEVVGPRLRIKVEDSGPGDQSAGQNPAQRSLIDSTSAVGGSPVSTGVGLANIRERLQQAYGDDHIFTTRSSPSGGYQVYIEIPYQRVRESASEPGLASDAAGSPAQTAANAAPSQAVNGEQAAALALNPTRAIGSSA
jgi:hypothetical protein